ncbi:MAG: ABC transporter ATP-binding protein [Acidobacteria bacterium]|nr:MAG: ABC transporter ATP-binding protein [Acidobacteriota bacterium]
MPDPTILGTEELDTREGARLIGRALVRRKVVLLAGMVLAALYTGFKVAVPVIFRSAVNRGFADGQPTGARLFPLIVLLIVMALGQSAAGGFRRYFAIRMSTRVATDLRQRLFEHWQRLSFGFHDRVQTGQLMARANSDLEQIQNFVVYIPLLFANLLTFVAAIVFMFVINVAMAAAALAVLPLLVLTARLMAKRLSPIVARIQQRLSDLTTVVEESIAGVRVVKALGREDEQVRRLTAVADEVRDEALAAARARAIYVPLLIMLPSVATLVVFWYGARQVISGQLELGDLISFMFFIGLLIWPLQLVGELTAQWKRAVASAARAHNVLDQDPQIVDLPGARAMPRGDGQIKFDDVSFSYDNGRSVLDHLSFEVPPGSSVAIVGPTGCGKSTVARLIPRFYEVDSGSILIDGCDIKEMTVRSLRDRIAIVFEDTFLFSDTIRENIAYGCIDADDAKIEEAARLARADEFIAALPDGLDTVVGEQGMTLSGGQRQRIAIARALLTDPEILILDSATTSVDAAVENQIRDALEVVMKGRTTVIVADRPATVSLAQEVIYLEGGRLMAQGRHQDLIREMPEYRNLMAGPDARLGDS